MSHVKEIRPFKVGSIKNNLLRRSLMILWFPFLATICVIGNILIGLWWIVKTVCSRVAYLCVDFRKCWKAPKVE